MTHHPLIDLLMFAIGIITSGFIESFFEKFISKYNLTFVALSKKIGNVLTTILFMALLVLLPLTFTVTWVWLEVAHDYYTWGNISNCILTILLNIVSCFHIVFTTHNMPKRRG